MKTFNLYRLESTDQGTFGIITHQGKWWYTLELPNRGNKPNRTRNNTNRLFY